MRVPTLLVACSFLLVGCLEVTSTQIGPPSLGYDRPRLGPDDVVVYRTEDQIQREYQEVALLHVTGSEAWSTESEVYRKLREEAGRLGANAVILQPVRELSGREKLAARRLNLDMGREGRALAIYVPPLGGAGAPGAGSGAIGRRDTGAIGPRDADATGRRDTGAFYTLFLEDGTVQPVAAAEPAGLGQIKVTLPDGTVQFLNSSKVAAIVDREGHDWTKWTLDDRRRLPRASGLF